MYHNDTIWLCKDGQKCPYPQHTHIEQEFPSLVSPRKKYVRQGELAILRKIWHSCPIAFLTGCFDIFHEGHRIQLRQARGYVPNGKLIVGVNSDASVKKLKGDNRPVQNQERRWEQVANIPYVDYVFIFNEETAVPSLERLKPDVFITYQEKLFDKPEIVFLLEQLPQSVFRINIDCAKDEEGHRISTTSIIESGKHPLNAQHTHLK